MATLSRKRKLIGTIAPLFFVLETANGLILHQDVPPPTTLLARQTTFPTIINSKLSPIHSSTLKQSPFLLSQEITLQIKEKEFKSDTVVRILDANTVKLEKSGLVSLAGAQTPSIGGFPECTATSPSKQLRKSLPKNSKVKVKIVKDGESANVARALILRDDNILVNAELVESGFAKPVARGRAAAEEWIPGFSDEMNRLNQQAKANRIGMYQMCTASADGSDSTSTATSKELASFPSNLDDQFEPLDVTTQTQWTSDGGKTILVEKGGGSFVPANPGDIKGCSDFETYEDALRWFETYQPYYGDVANLDRDGDGVPCPKLPHTKNMDRFRRKVPSSQVGSGMEISRKDSEE